MSVTGSEITRDPIKVSVIVLTYNHKEYIVQALESILSQQVDFRYEILIGDDGSSDHTADIVRDYARRYPDIIRPIIRKKNIGAARNLYDLLLGARGAYIANLEGDDFWSDINKLQIQVDCLDRHPKYIGCYHSCKVVDEEGCDLAKPKWICETGEFGFRDFKGIYLPGHPSTWVYRNIYINCLHDYSIIYKAHPVIADRTIAMILLAQGLFGFIAREMSCYRCIRKENGKNATSKFFVNQDNSKYIEFQLTLTLERYAKEELGIHADFQAFRWLLFIKAFIKLVMKPCKGRWRCVKAIVCAATKGKRFDSIR